MNVKFIFCIILGIILYILINKIEGLICRGPLDVALGNPDRTARIGKLNRGSLPFFPKDNVLVYSEVDPVGYITETSKRIPYNNNASLTLICSQGLKDERQEKLAPYTPLTSQGNNLTCHNPSKKAIFYRIHGSIKTQDVVRVELRGGSINSNVTQIPKKMQLIFYINDGDCYRQRINITKSTMRSIFVGIYEGVDISLPDRNLLTQPQPGENSLFDKGFSELESINGIYMLTIDGNNILIQLKRQNPELVVFNSSQDNVYSMTCNAAFFSDQNIPLIFTKLYLSKNTNLLFAIGPYSGTFPIIDFSDNNDRLDRIIDRYPNVFVLENYVSVEYSIPTPSDEPQTITFTYTMENMEKMEVLKHLIKRLIRSQSVSVSISYLSPTFQSSDSFRRLFNGNVEIELPIFCLSILSHPYFVNPFNHPIYGEYALPGGQYIAQDLIDLIFDIIGQITSDDYSVVKSVYYRKMRSLGMDDIQIKDFLDQCNFLYTQTIIPYSIPEDYPLLPFMNLWEPWSYPTTDRSDHIIFKWSMQTFLLLIQLFKQEEGEAIDVHSFTCLEGIGDERTTNNAKMDYSWQYAYSDDEANNPENQEKRIGPECQRPVCQQSENDINDRLVDLGRSEFIVDSGLFESGDKHPKSREITYTKNEGNITINRDYIEPTGITVKCINKPNVTRQIYCKYNEHALEQLKYDDSILELDPRDCDDASLGRTILNQAVEVTPFEVTQLCGAGLKINFDHF